MPEPRITYLVCATPRSGSTLLCRTLCETGVAGYPDEYFEALPHSGLPLQPREYVTGLNDPAIERLLPPLRRSDPLPPIRDRLAAAHARGTTPNGVFGVKVMWGYFPPLREALDLSGARYVLVRRRDKLRQAISLWRAIQTQQWNADATPAAAPVFSRAAIEFLRRRLAEQEAAWEGWLRGRDPLLLTYEDFAERPQEAAAAVLEHLGVAVSGTLPAAAALRRQADALTEEWLRGYAGGLK